MSSAGSVLTSSAATEHDTEPLLQSTAVANIIWDVVNRDNLGCCEPPKEHSFVDWCRRIALHRTESTAANTAATEQPTKRKRDGQTAKNRQPLQEKQDASGSTPIASQCTNNDYLAKCQQQARHTYTLPPCVSSDGLSEKQIARGDFYLRPNDRYTKRQQDLLDMDEDDGSETGWKYSKDETIS